MKYRVIDGIRYETLSVLRRIFNTLVICPLVNRLVPEKILTDFLRNTDSPLVQESISRPGGWRAMRIAYADGEPRDWVDRIVLKKATLTLAARNRKRMVVAELCELIKRYLKEGEVHIVGIGTGPGFNVMEAMAIAGTDRIYAHCIDEDAAAFEHGRELAEKWGLRGRIRFIRGNAVSLEPMLEGIPQIAKMVGLVEYLTDEQVTELFGVCREMLASGGSILVNSVGEGHGVDRYLRRIFKWHLTYRSPRKLLRMLKECGFRDFTVRSEPLGVYSSVIASKE